MFERAHELQVLFESARAFRDYSELESTLRKIENELGLTVAAEYISLLSTQEKVKVGILDGYDGRPFKEDYESTPTSLPTPKRKPLHPDAGEPAAEE